MLSDVDISRQPSGEKHIVSRLEHALQVGRIALSEWQLLGELVEGDTPGDRSVFPGNLQ